MEASWSAWARHLTGLSSTAKLIALELAMLADTRGVAVVPLDHLEKIADRSPRSIRAALAQLQGCRYLLPPEVMPPPFRGLRLQLVRDGPDPGIAGGCAPPGGATQPLPTRVHLGGNATGSGDDDPETGDPLRAHLAGAMAASWQGPSCWALAALLEKQGPQRFSSVISRRRGSGVTDPWDTLTLAWEVIQHHQQILMGAKEPWALWVHLVKNECARIDMPLGTEDPLEAEPPEEPHRARPPDEGIFHFGIDDFDAGIARAVRTLVEVGMDEATAWAGTARILELVGIGQSRRHWLAARDAKLGAMGVSERAAREWMTLLVGSRRGRPGMLSGADPGGSHAHARAVVAAMR